MKYLKLITMVAVAAFCLMAVDAMAAGKPNPYDTVVESPFKGLVMNIGPSNVSVKGEVKFKNAPKANPNGNAEKVKTPHENVHFSIKGAKLTRDGKPCELKDVQKGDSATVTFTPPKEGSTKYVATQVDFSTKGLGAAEEKKQ